LGAAGRLYLAASVIQFFVFDRMGEYRISFEWSVSVILLLMLLYTYKGGIRTLVFTDTFQSLFLVLGVVLSIAAIIHGMHLSFFEAVKGIYKSEYYKTFFFEFNKTNFVLKEFLGGVFIAACMTGLDQNMMQKNLSCKNLKEAQKNIFWFSIVMVVVTLCFLSLGALLYQYYEFAGIPLPADAQSGKVITDKVFPNLALNHLGTFAGMVFIIGLTAATFSSADSVLTTLTTSTYIDILEIEKKPVSAKIKSKFRILIHIGYAFLLWLVILLFNELNQQAIITTILMVAGYTYGPLLALFFIGLFTKIELSDKLVPIACLVGPLLCYGLKQYTLSRPEGYQIGNELILMNGIITVICLLAFRKKTTL
jgi:Na+/proline symporter